MEPKSTTSTSRECGPYGPEGNQNSDHGWHPLPFSKEVKPIRVINLAATLDSSYGGIWFDKPCKWNFHVISHTWCQSAHDLSERIRHRLAAASNKGSGSTATDAGFSTYNQAFREIDLRKDRSYRDLMEFLGLIAQDGVENVWLDALCIDQTSTSEKDTEIPNMGAYYGNSKGCYVALHGIGEGYELWKGVGRRGEFQCPRWFTRAWTLQELVLPKALRFIVGGLSEIVIHLANGRRRFMKSKSGLCQCCMFSRQDYDALCIIDGTPHIVEQRRISSRVHDLCGGQGDVASSEYDCWRNETGKALSPYAILLGWRKGMRKDGEALFERRNQVCKACGTLPLIRKLSTTVAPLYVVDREAYPFLLTLARMSDYPGFATVPTDYEALIGLFNRAYEPWTVASEMRRRQCSNEEDRILSILGLLGATTGTKQLRTQRTLQQQMVEMAKLCGPEFILRLCMMDVEGNAALGLSWTPTLLQKQNKDPAGSKPPVHHAAIGPALVEFEVADVSLQGLKLKTKVVAARVVGRLNHLQIFDTTGQVVMSMEVNQDYQTTSATDVVDLQQLTEVITLFRKPSWGVFEHNYVPELVSSLFSPTSKQQLSSEHDPDPVGESHVFTSLGFRSAMDYDVWMVLLGEYTLKTLHTKVLGFHTGRKKKGPRSQVSAPKEYVLENRKLAMVCVGNDPAGNYLHKTGLISWPSQMGNELFSRASISRECVVGGFGRDLLNCTRPPNAPQN